MYRLIAFDLDKTLADLGKGITQANIDKLKYLESRGATIAICSGKPTYYLCGFMRQVGLKKPVLIGENGACIQFGVDLPPQEEVIVDYPAQAKSVLAKIRMDLCAMFSEDIWLQPNAVCVTPFPKSRKAFERIQRYVDDNKSQFASVCVYRHVDSFDFIPMGINKKTALERLTAFMGITAMQTAAVGDGVNDYPMFEFADLAVGIRVADPNAVTVNLDTIDAALDYLIRTTEETIC